MFTLKVRRRLRAQASLVDVLGSSWIFAVLAIAGIALLIGVAHAVTNGITYEHEVASVHNVVTALERDKLASQAAFVPATDLAGVSNADGHEFDLYQQGLHHNGHFFAYCFTAAAGECQPSQPLDTLAVYTYAWASLPRNGGHAPSISIYRPPSSGLTGFSVHDYFGGPALVAHFAGIAALNAKTPFASSCVPKVYHWGYPVTPAPGGYPALVSATCRAFRATLTDGRFSEAIGLTDQHIPFVQTVIIGTATPTPMPLLAAPNPLHFSSPVAPVQSFQASESNYGNRVTVPAQQYSIAGCSGIAQVAPSGGSIAPSYNGSAGVTNVQVLPVVSPAPNGASCAVDVTDNTPQTTSVPVSIGDTFAPSAQGYAVNFTGSSTVAPIVTKEQNYAVGPSQGGRGGFIFRYYSTVTPTGICSPPNAANATVSSDGTLTVAQQWSVPMSGAGVCTAVFEDAYGRMFAAQVQANALAMKTWPAGGIVEAASGSTLAMLPMHEPLIAELFGAAMADALTTGCKAVAIQSGTYPTSYTPATTTSLPAAAQALLANAVGGPYTVDATGCVLQNGTPAAQAPVIAYVPNDTSATTPTYNPNTLGCSNVASLGQVNPTNASGAQVLIPVLPGSNAGSCTVTVATTPAQASAPAGGSGLVPVGVVGPCPTGTSVLPIGVGCFAPPALSLGVWSCGKNGTNASGTSTTTYGFTIGPIVAKTAPPQVPSSVGIVSGVDSAYSGPIFTRTGPGTVYVYAFTESKSPGNYCKPIIMSSYSYDGITLK